jgi:hypothetical protein
MKITLSPNASGTLKRRRRYGRITDPERKAAFDGTMTDEQIEFIYAVQAWKRLNRRNWPAFTELLAILKQLGYRKVLPRDVQLDGAPEPPLWWNARNS